MVSKDCLVAIVLLALASAGEAKSKKRIGPHHSLDKELKVRRQGCEAEVDMSITPHERENLILSCLCEECYQTIYANDPLEEGEVDSARGRDYRSCCRSALRTHRLESKTKPAGAEAEEEEEETDGEAAEDEGEARDPQQQSAGNADASGGPAAVSAAADTTQR